MEHVEQILARARARAIEMNLPYSGALLPTEAHAFQQQLPGAALVDVRTRAEWDWVGRVPQSVEIEWVSYPGNRPNSDFVQQLLAKLPIETPLMFICRSGARSHAAAIAAQAAGYATCFNVLQGFEGDKDGQSHRSTVGGWRAAGLPWTQS